MTFIRGLPLFSFTKFDVVVVYLVVVSVIVVNVVMVVYTSVVDTVDFCTGWRLKKLLYNLHFKNTAERERKREKEREREREREREK